MLVHDVDHAVADSPEEEQRTDQDEGENQIGAIGANEETFLFRAHRVRNDSNRAKGALRAGQR